MVDEKYLGPVLAGCGAVGGIVGTALPWVWSGSAARSSFESFDLVNRLGFTSGGLIETALRWWALVPLAFVGLTVLAWLTAEGHVGRRWLISLGALAVIWIGGISLAVASAPDAGIVRPGIGPIVTAISCVLAAVGVAITARRSPISAAS